MSGRYGRAAQYGSYSTNKGKGIYVSEINENLINNIFEARKNLEVSALKLTTNKLQINFQK